MASMYPSLEDMKVDQIQQAVVSTQQEPNNTLYGSNAPYPPVAQMDGGSSAAIATAYPSLMEEYMGLQLEPPTGFPTPPSQQQSAMVSTTPSGPVQTIISSGGTMMVAPITGQSVGLVRANVTHGVREVVLCHAQDGKVGLGLRAVNKLVANGSPAALVGIRFGDQILQIDGQNLAGFSEDKAMNLIKKTKNPQRIVLVIRDRPFERTIILHKDSAGYCGFQYRDNQIVAVVKDSSAARNGILTDHHVLEINGQNVVGMKNKEFGKILQDAPMTVTLTVMPSQIYDHMVKNLSGGLLKKKMDHSIPSV